MYYLVYFLSISVPDRLLRSGLWPSLNFTSKQKLPPFQVLAVRAMAQFVGGESKYNGIVAGLKEIYRENGLIGELEFWHN